MLGSNHFLSVKIASMKLLSHGRRDEVLAIFPWFAGTWFQRIPEFLPRTYLLLVYLVACRCVVLGCCHSLLFLSSNLALPPIFFGWWSSTGQVPQIVWMNTFKCISWVSHSRELNVVLSFLDCVWCSVLSWKRSVFFYYFSSHTCV